MTTVPVTEGIVVRSILNGAPNKAARERLYAERTKCANPVCGNALSPGEVQDGECALCDTPVAAAITTS